MHETSQNDKVAPLLGCSMLDLGYAANQFAFQSSSCHTVRVKTLFLPARGGVKGGKDHQWYALTMASFTVLKGLS